MQSTVLLLAALAFAQLPAEKPPQTPPPAPPRPPASTPARQPPAARPSITLFVTDRTGKPIEGVTVSASGPASREGKTEADGTLVLRNVAAGVYRLHFEHPGFLAFEREVSVQGRAIKTTAELTPAPPPPPAPEPPSAPKPPEPRPLPPPGPPTSVSIPDFVEKNYVGNNPSRNSPVACTGTRQARCSSSAIRWSTTSTAKPTRCSTSSPARACSGSVARRCR